MERGGECKECFFGHPNKKKENTKIKTTNLYAHYTQFNSNKCRENSKSCVR